MKTTTLKHSIYAMLICLLAFTGINKLNAQCTGIVNIPDANFKAYLLGNAAINTNGDAEIQCSEAAAFTGTIDVNNLSISSLTGIEAFTSLTSLDCSNNNLTSLDVSHNTALTVLSCYFNQLTSLDVTKNTALTYLNCNNNTINSLDVSKNVVLTVLSFADNKLSSIDITANTALTEFVGNQNMIPSIDFSHNILLTNLSYTDNNATSIDLSANPLITILNLFNNLLNSVDVSNLSGLDYFNCSKNNLSTLNVSNNHVITNLRCHTNHLSSLNLSSNTALLSFACYNNNLTSLNLKNGNNAILTNLNATSNASLSCIQVDNVANSNGYAGWSKDAGASYSTNCNPCTPSTSTTNTSICPSALPYSWNGLTFTASGSQTAHLTNAAGCDSAATLNLTVKDASISITDLSICPNELPYHWNSQTIFGAGRTVVVLTNAVGCDSTATLNLTVKNTSTSTTNATICPIQLPYVWNGLTFTASGSQTAHLTNAAGCDSAATLNLTVNPNYTITASAGSGGSISPSGASDVCRGNHQTYNITANTGYSIADVLVDGSSVGAVGGYTFTNVTTAHTIIATFSCIVNIPDANFKAYLVGTALINTNGDTEIQCSEAAAYTGYLNVSNLGITDLTGIEAFTALTILNCASNNLSSLDVSANTALTTLFCQNTGLSSLDVSHNTNLANLNCRSNNLGSLNVAANTALIELFCDNTGLSSLDMSHNTALTILYCNNNSLSSLNVSTNAVLVTLACSNNTISSLNVSGNTVLKRLFCNNNNLASLNIKNGNNANILDIDAINNINLYCIEVDNVANANANGSWHKDAGASYSTNCCIVTIPNATFKAYLVGNAAININGDGEIQCSEAGAFTGAINVNFKGISNLTGIEAFTALTYLDCGNNSLTSLDVSHNTALTTLDCQGNSITSLDVSHNTALTNLECYTNDLTSLDVSHNTALTYLDCYHNQLSSLDVSHNIALTYLDCNRNSLSSLDVSHNTALTILDCGNNSLSSLDVSHNTAFARLYCFINRLTSLDLAKNTALSSLFCYGNKLTSLDLTKNTLLNILRCDTNKLASLDLTKNTVLYYLQCNNNNLTDLNIKNGNNGNLAFSSMLANNNPSLTCIQVDNVANANGYTTSGNWHKDAGASYSTSCNCTPTLSTFTVSACSSYTWVAKGNKVYTASNTTDTIILVNAGGCDSVVTLNLTIKAATSSSSNASV